MPPPPRSSCVHTGVVNVKVSAEAQQTAVLCGSEVAAVPDVGRVDTVVRTLLVEVSECPTCTCNTKITVAPQNP